MAANLPRDAGASASSHGRYPRAVLAADISGYTRLMEVAEDATHSRWMALRVSVIDPAVVSFRGRTVKNTGDGFISSFESALDAVRCALAIQHDVEQSEASEAPDRRIHLRLGVNFGDIIIEDFDIFGGAVNIAARLQEAAAPGGIVISASVRDRLDARPDLLVDDLGQLRLKNIARPLQAYAVRRHGASPRHGVEPGAPTPLRAALPWVAVLPFRQIGGRPRDDYFGEGLVEDIITALAGRQGLFVVARGSTLAYRDEPADVRKVAQDLGVRYVLSGSVRRARNRLRMAAQLSDAETGFILWADRFDGVGADLFELQDRISARIGATIAPHVQQAERQRVLRTRPATLTAYDFFLRGLDLLRMDFDHFSRARPFFEKAIEADNGFATAHAYLSLWHVFNVGQGWSGDAEADSEEASRAAAAAIERDPHNALGLALYGHARSFLARDFATGSVYLERAILASPSHAMAWTLSSGTHSYRGDARKALDHAERAMRLSPLDTFQFFLIQFLTLAYYVGGDFEQAVTWGYRGFRQNSQYSATLRLLAISLAALGRRDEAKEIGQALVKIEPRFRVSSYAPRCPMEDPHARDTVLERLRMAGLPE